ncbi:hypothetical protein CEXT_434051 [Caerostris extrusa]|uniref:Uncharacterized protein n=1 Tax=Caerostris extrusa TaxID=172846 RepID=A0AAV4XY59_CAEEX|nr:hypothetical protein CEXT_434051 [Caerostris extrusa]
MELHRLSKNVRFFTSVVEVASILTLRLFLGLSVYGKNQVPTPLVADPPVAIVLEDPSKIHKQCQKKKHLTLKVENRSIVPTPIPSLVFCIPQKAISIVYKNVLERVFQSVENFADHEES